MPLIVANIFIGVLLVSIMIPGDWAIETKFAAISLCIGCSVVALYNLGIEGKENRPVVSLGLSAISFSLMSVIGILFLH